MARSRFRRSPRVESLESRQLLSSVGPASADEQAMLSWINLARTDPPAAAQRIAANITPDIQATVQHYGVDLGATEQAISSAAPQPPVAWSDQLAQAAQGHSQDMASHQFQSHTGWDGSSSQQRIQQAGYTNASVSGENAYAYASSVDQAMEAFLIDWGVPGTGHRNNLLQPGVSAANAYRDVGIGMAQTSGSSQVGPLVVTQDFGAQSNEPAQLVGVAYNDPNNTGYYPSNEGVANVQIDAVNLQTGQVSSTQSGPYGGYQVALSSGSYRIIASLNDQVIQTVNLTVGGANVDQNFVLTNPWVGGSRAAALAAAQPVSNAPVVVRPVVSIPVAAQPMVSAPVTPQPQPTPVAMGAVTWNWTSWQAALSS